LSGPQTVWNLQTQVWQWVREGVVFKAGDNPLTAMFRRGHEELMVVLSYSAQPCPPHHLREALTYRRVALSKR
jgi:hypothetical protein